MCKVSRIEARKKRNKKRRTCTDVWGQFWEAGTCRQGSSCNFAHSSDEVVKRRGGGGNNNQRRDGGRDGGNRGGGGGGGGNRHYNNNNNRDTFVLPERPQVALPNLNEGKSTEEIELASRREAERRAKQKEFVDKFLEEIKYDESVMHED